MYKSKLQELCHSNSWDLPEYIMTKNGPDHCPDFGASITVNGIFFQTQAPVKSSKMAQNDVAKLAYNYFSTVPFPQATPQPTIATTLLPSSQPLMPQKPALPLQQQHQETSCFVLFPQPSILTKAFHQPSIISSPGCLESTYENDKLFGVSMSAQIEKDKAQLTVVNAMSSVLKDNDAHTEPKRMYKHQLQHYAQKKNLKFPVYSCKREGPSHASRFKCDVTIDGKTYTSDDSFSAVKYAENEVARIALASLSQLGAQDLIQDDYNHYKNLLQELTQKRKSNLPIYKTEKFGESHIPKFISTVEFEGAIFTGQASKTKKQAEMSAAEVAYHAMRKRLTSRTESVHNLQLNMANEPQQSVKPNASINLNSCLTTTKQGEETVEFEEAICTGQASKTKKQAEMCAAEVAYHAMRKRLASRTESVHDLQLNMANEPQQSVKPNASINLNSCLTTTKQGEETVEFEEAICTGQASKTKKQAEMSAAEVAYHAMRKRLTSRTESVHDLQLNMANEPQQSVKPNASINLNSCLTTTKQGEETVEFEEAICTGQASKTKKQAEMSAAEVAYHAMRKRLTSQTESVHNLQLNMANEPQHTVKPNASINLNSCLTTTKQGSDCSPACDGGSSFNCGGIQDAIVSSSTELLCHLSSDSEGTPSKRICIYPHTTNMTHPEGGVILPMSDDKWVALSLSGNQNSSANV